MYVIEFEKEKMTLRVPKEVHKIIKNRLKIPMNNQVRSLNIASSVAIVLAESLRQIELI